jgi:DNA mismatch repair protein MutL
MRAPVRILTEELANQIAAGEVVERPASVLKELVENALDAGAARVVVEVAAAGRRLIRVVDDGWGMTPDDLLTALERHATSKLSSQEDLEGVSTLGFRGEALPSIAAVSKLRLTSRPADQEVGSQVMVQGGAIREVKEVGCRQGTTIEVADLFFNTPARRKFLKTRATEAGHLGAAFLRLALARPDVSFRYRSEGQVLYDLPAGADLAERAAILLGREAAGQMIALEQEAGPIKVSGLLGLPSLNRSGPDQIFTFVNRRFVRDRILMHAIGQAYRGFMPDGRRPVMILNIDLDPRRVDVNVHPAKVEVRFRDSQEVHAALVQCVRRGLAQAPRPKDQPLRRPQPGEPPPPAQWRAPQRDFAPPAHAPQAGYTAPAVSAPVASTTPEPAEPLPTPEPAPNGGLKPRPLFGVAGELTYLSQLHGLYLLCSSPHGLVIIDQHAAHERLSYEQLLGALEGKTMPSQGLLVPRTLELTPQEAGWAANQAPAWAKLGLIMEPFGGNTWAVREVPPLMAGADPGPIMRNLLAEMAACPVPADRPEYLEEAVKSLACRGSIKSGQRLGEEEARRLVAKMAALAPPVTCPHGRPVMLTIGRAELTKAFKRS